MSHRCARCGRVYEDGDPEMLKGCSCGGKKFFYVKGIKNLEDVISEIDVVDESDTEDEGKEHVESIKMLNDGSYNLNLDLLLRRDEIIIEKKDGSYALHLPSFFKKKS